MKKLAWFIACLSFALLSASGAMAQRVTPLHGNEQIPLQFPCTIGCYTTMNDIVALVGGHGGGAVASVSDNGGGTLVISPNIGAVLAGCATASTSQTGCVKLDGSTIGLNGAGAISVTIPPTLPPDFSVSAGCGNTATGGSITALNPSGSINSAFGETRAVTTYPDTLQVVDCGGVVVFRSATNQTENLPQAGSTGFTQNFGFTYCNAGAGVIQLLPASGTIGKLSSYNLGAGTEAARTCVGVYSGTYSGAAGAFVSNDWGLVTGDSSIFPGTIQQTTGYSAAGTALPTCNTAAKGSFAWVSDATSPTFLATYTSGGAVIAPVFCNGTNWVTH